MSEKRRFKSSKLNKNRIYRITAVPLLVLTFKIFKGIITALPVRAVYRLGKILGLVAWYASKRRRRIAERNLEIAFGDDYNRKERRTIARKSMQHFCLTALDVFLLPRYKGEKWRDIVHLTEEQDEQLQSLAQHPGTVALHTGHLGSWETCSGVAAVSRRKLAIVYRALDIPAIDAEVRKLRTQAGHRAYEKSGALKGYIQSLKNNEWLGIIADQNAGSGAAFLSFFNVPAATEVSYFPLLLRFNTRIVAFFAIRNGFNFNFHCHGFYEITPSKTTDRREESLRLGQWYNDCIEEVVRQHPEQYCWVHRRWKSRPEHAPGLYDNIDQPLSPEVLQEQPASPINPRKWRQ
ncbi:MAG: lysophospholipid acyltransferase family protein [Verrucomicrobiota bacterium]